MRRSIYVRSFALLLVVPLLAGLVVPAPSARAASAPSTTVVVAAPVLNLRTAPRLSAPVVAVLKQGTVLHVWFYHVSWVAVTTPDDLIGYVNRYDVRPTTAPAARRIPFGPPYLTVVVAAANLRAAPALTAPVVAVLPHLTPLGLIGTQGTWAHVVTRAGQAGWMARSLLRPVCCH